MDLKPTPFNLSKGGSHELNSVQKPSAARPSVLECLGVTKTEFGKSTYYNGDHW